MIIRGLFFLTFLTTTTKLISHGGTDPSSRADATTIATRSKNCKDVNPDEVTCAFNSSCVYGELYTVQCRVAQDNPCEGDHKFKVTIPCLYCWQLPEEYYTCSGSASCKPHTRYLATCKVNSTTHCMGNRKFDRYKQCNNMTGHKWSLALVLSVLFGGFGVDRFYLGHWQEGVGKIFSFGGFGVWTLTDSILIAIGYLKPAESSQYEL